MSVQPSQPETGPLNPALQQSALIKRLNSQGPSIQEVASDLLANELKRLYPNLDIDPDTTLVVTPLWEFIDDDLSCTEMAYEPLTNVLLRQSLEKTLGNYVEGEHFLTREPLSQTPMHLEVSIEDIANLLNELAGVFFCAFKERQLAFWNDSVNQLPRWQELSDRLREALNVEAVGAWSADHCTIAQAISAYPDKAVRKIERPELADVQVCLIDIDTPGSEGLEHIMLVGAAVLIGRYHERDILLIYSSDYGYEAFDTVQALGSAIFTRLSPDTGSIALSWRLVEPEGNFFDQMAWALIDTQLQSIDPNDLDVPQIPFSLNLPSTRQLDKPEQARLDQLQEAIPEWLYNASSQDLNAYSQHLIDLSLLRDKAPKDLFEIPSIHTFAQQKMREAIIADKTAEGADKLPLDTLQIIRTESFTVGVFVLPNPQERHTQTLGEYALSNSPPYLASVSFEGGQAVPEWLTPEYLTTLAEQVDIGKVYPQLIKSKLIDDPAEAHRQKQMYQRQLRSLLPLLALEYKVRQQGNVDEQGYGYINELISPTPHNRQPIVVRPLSLYPHHRVGSGSDRVLNMFLIGPRNSQDGPWLLYRPLMDTPLLQFQSWQNLLYALHQPGELRDSVIAWLPNRALSFNYSQYMFPVGLPSPWLTVQSLSEPLILLEWSGTVGFSTTELTGDVFATFYDDNAKAMVELADRQSQSNAQRRWALLEDSGWAVFNSVSGLLNGYVGAAVWAWQIIHDLQQALDAHQQGNSLIEWTRLGDVLMALAIVLIHQANQRRQTEDGAQRPVQARPPTPVTNPVLTARPTITAKNGLLPHSEFATIAVDGSVPRRTPEQMNTFLDSLKVDAPDMSDPDLTIVTPAHIPPLYQLHDKAFAQVDQRWFEVTQDADEAILILNPQRPSRTGPRLTHSYDHDTHWQINTNLRLLGSGKSLKSKLRASRLARTQRLQELEQQLKTWKEKETSAKNELSRLRQQFTPEGISQLLQPYLDKIDELIALYQDALAGLQAWREAGGIAGYTQELFRLSTEYHKHLCLWTSYEQHRYTQAMELVKQCLYDDLSPRQALLDNITQMTQRGNAMLIKLERLKVSLAPLPLVGAAGIIAAERLKALAPGFTQWDIKTNEIATIHELCLREQAASHMEDARWAVGLVVERTARASKEIAQMMRNATKHAQPEERIERLLTIVEEYASVSQRIDELPVDFPELVEPVPLQRLKTLAGEFQQLAQETLDSLLPHLDKSQVVAQKPSIAGPSRPRPKVSISKTRPRDLPGKSTDAPKQQPLPIIQPRAPRPAIRTKEYTQAISAALDLNLDTDNFIQRTQHDALQPKRVPADMQDIFDQQAVRLEQAADLIETMNTEDLEKPGEMLPVASLPLELREGAAKMRREGIATRAKMLKARKPRQADFQWLLEHAQVRLWRNNTGRIKTQQYNDYFQEYQILDTANQDQPLWLAHFHYPTLDTPASRFTAAHLKIAEQHLQQFSPEASQTLSTRSPWDNYLRTLSDPVLQAAFLQLEPPGR